MESKVALITGCSSDLGRKLCILLAQKGYQVVATARDISKIDEIPADIKLEMDVSDKESIEIAIEKIVRQYGKIINVGSISGKLTGFVNGGYCASKHAVEAISDAARLELQSFGIQVSVHEPGAMDTDFFKTLSKNSDQRMKNNKLPYSKLYQNDLNFRKKQKRADVGKATEDIYKILKSINFCVIQSNS